MKHVRACPMGVAAGGGARTDGAAVQDPVPQQVPAAQGGARPLRGRDAAPARRPCRCPGSQRKMALPGTAPDISCFHQSWEPMSSSIKVDAHHPSQTASRPTQHQLRQPVPRDMQRQSVKIAFQGMRVWHMPAGGDGAAAGAQGGPARRSLCPQDRTASGGAPGALLFAHLAVPEHR